MSNLIESFIYEFTLEYIESIFIDDIYGCFVLGFNTKSGKFKSDFYGSGYIKSQLLQHLNNKHYHHFIYAKANDEIDAFNLLCDYYHYVNQPFATHPSPPVGAQCLHCGFHGGQVL